MTSIKTVSVSECSGTSHGDLDRNLVAPAAAAPNKAEQSAYCDPLATEGAATFSLFGGSSVAARGGDAREPDLDQVHAELPASAKGKAGKNFRQSVPVWFHVVSDGAIGNISNTVIQEQMNVLNLAFAGFYGGVNTGFSFRLAGVTRTNNAAWHYSAIGGADAHAMKRTLHRGGPETLNIYATTAEAYLGWAYLPDIVTKPGQAYLDGIVVDWESMPGASTRYAGQYDLGQTATHEVGHWLNLEHTFFGGCNAKGDFVDDTPAQKVPTNGCPRARTRAERRVSTRSTTTWTTRTTPATGSSPRARRSACATPGSSGARSAEHDRATTGRRKPARFRSGYTPLPAPVAQGIERSPPEREVAGSNPAGRTRGFRKPS